MADIKPQPQLDTTNHRRPSRGTRCCCCLFSLIWYFLLLVLLLALLVILVSYIILQPRSFKFHVTQANLSEFNYTENTNTLHYNLLLNFTIRNPNKKLGIYFDEARGNALYQGSRFATTSLQAPWFSYLLHTKSTVPMSVVFSGQKVVVLDVDDFERDKSEGAFGFDLKIYFEIRFRLGNFIGNGLITKARAKCGIKVPLTSNGSNIGSTTLGELFETTKCEVDF